MTIHFIRYNTNQSHTLVGGFSVDRSADLKKLSHTRAPQVLLTSNHNLDRLKSFDDLILDRGKKDSRKGLAALLITKAQGDIRLISAAFSSIGKLENSIQRLLSRATALDYNKTFIIAVNHQLFVSVGEHLNRGDHSGHKLMLKIEGDRQQGADCASHSLTSDRVTEYPNRSDSDDLFDVEVPDDLKRKYLGNSIEFDMVRKMIIRASESEEIPVLILGPSGTGKERVARSIHEKSRCKGQFITVNCGAISRELLESELFGHKKGSYSNAYEDKTGMWEAANRGTLFLDEIGDLLPEHQVKILRALDKKEIRPIGENKVIKVSARIIAATNRDLYSMVKENQFREDLYYRLRLFVIRTPALMPTEIPAIADILWKEINEEDSPSLSESIKTRLKYYAWPGNIRHLKNVLRQLHALFPRKELDARHLDWVMSMDGHTPPLAPQSSAEIDAELNIANCLQHLRQADEVMQASWNIISPCLQSDDPDHEKVSYLRSQTQYHLKEMELLFKDPIYFSNEETFIAVINFEGKLKYFDSLLNHEYRSAKRYWENEIKNELEKVLNAINNEIEAIQEKV